MLELCRSAKAAVKHQQSAKVPLKAWPPVEAAMLGMFLLKAEGCLPVASEQMSASQPDSTSPESGIDRANMFPTLPCSRTCEPPRPRMVHVNTSSRWFKQVNRKEGGFRWQREGTHNDQLGWKETDREVQRWGGHCTSTRGREGGR